MGRDRDITSILDQLRAKLPFHSSAPLPAQDESGARTLNLLDARGGVVAVLKAAFRAELSKDLLEYNPHAWKAEAEVLSHLMLAGCQSAPLPLQQGVSEVEGWSYFVTRDLSRGHGRALLGPDGVFLPLSGAQKWQAAKAYAGLIDASFTNSALAGTLEKVLPVLEDKGLSLYPRVIANRDVGAASFFFPAQTSAPAVVLGWQRAAVCRVPRLFQELLPGERLAYESFDLRGFLESVYSLSRTLKKRVPLARFLDDTESLLG